VNENEINSRMRYAKGRKKKKEGPLESEKTGAQSIKENTFRKRGTRKKAAY